MSNSGTGTGIRDSAMILTRDLFDTLVRALDTDDPVGRNKALMALGRAAPLGWSIPDGDEESPDDDAVAQVDAQQSQRQLRAGHNTRAGMWPGGEPDNVRAAYDGR